MRVKKSIMMGSKYIADDDNIFNVSLSDVFRYLENSHEFYKNRDSETLKKVLAEYLKLCSETLTDDYGYFVEKVIPNFLTKDRTGKYITGE